MQEENKYYLCHIEYIDRDGAHDEYIVTNDEDAMLRDYKRAYPERIITACATAELARVISAVQNKDTPDNAYRDAIVRLIDRQRAKGMDKYGQTLEENTTLTTEQRIEHAQEELVDALQYLEHLKQTQADKLTAEAWNRRAHADVVEVVRCKDCKWWHTDGCAFRKDAVKDLPAADDFCSHGERKGD